MKNAKKYLMITIGCVIFSVGISLFLDPNKLAPGGVSGISIIISHFIPIKTGTLIFLLNVPLLILGYFKFGKKFILPTLYAIVISSIFIDLMSLLLGPMTSDKLLAAVSGGALSGCGIGVVFRAGGTTGGTDIVVKVLKQKFRQLKTGILLFSVDSLIVASSAVVFGDIDVALYAAIGLVVSSIVVDIVLYGTDGAKLVFIVSDCPEKIALRLLSELDIGATYINGVGAFSNEKKCVLMVAIKKNMFYKLRDIITKDDQKAFMIVSSANEIFGEGFKAHNSEEL